MPNYTNRLSKDSNFDGAGDPADYVDGLASDVKPKRKAELSAPAKTRPQPIKKRILENFSGEDINSVASYIILDVLIPAAKSALSDAVSQGIERLLFGGSRPGGRPSQGVNYNRVSSTSSLQRGSRESGSRTRNPQNFEEIILETRSDAQDVLATMEEHIQDYGLATIRDLYDCVGLTGSFVDDRWGWTRIRGTVVRVSGGYAVDLGRPKPLD